MPLERGSVTFTRFAVERTRADPKDARRSLATALRRHAFEPLDPSGEEDRAAGWVELEDPESSNLAPASFLFGDHLLIAWRVDTLRVPTAHVRAELDRWARAHEAESGQPPKRAEKTAQKELIVKKLRKRAFPTRRTYDVSWSFETDQLLIWTTTKKVLEEVTEVMEESMGLRLHALSPGALCQLQDIDPDAVQPTDALFGEEVVQEARARVGS